ncbi:Pleckstrin [Trichinella pseudospiralis]
MCTNITDNGTKRIKYMKKNENADDTKENEGQLVCVVPRGSPFCRSGLGILRKGCNFSDLEILLRDRPVIGLRDEEL